MQEQPSRTHRSHSSSVSSGLSSTLCGVDSEVMGLGRCTRPLKLFPGDTSFVIVRISSQRRTESAVCSALMLLLKGEPLTCFAATEEINSRRVKRGENLPAVRGDETTAAS